MAVYKYVVFTTADPPVRFEILSESDVAPTEGPGGEPIDPSKTFIEYFYGDEQKFNSDGSSNVKIATASEDDGRPIFSPYPASVSFGTFISGRGDNLSPTPPSTGRGQGQAIYLAWDGTETGAGLTKTAILSLLEPVELHDGHADYKPAEQFCGLDELSLGILINASAPEAGGSELNLVAEAPPEGHPFHGIPGVVRYNFVTPGTGTHSVPMVDDAIIDFSNMRPADVSRVTAVNKLSLYGNWDVDKVTGKVTPSEEPGTGRYDFINIPLQPEFLRNCPLGSPIGELDVDVARAEWLHQSWQIVVKVVKDDTKWGAYAAGGKGACEMSGFITLYRAVRG